MDFIYNKEPLKKPKILCYVLPKDSYEHSITV